MIDERKHQDTDEPQAVEPADGSTCSVCKFFDSIVENKKAGFCRYSPPTLADYDCEGHRYGLWPEVNYKDWCGKYTPNAKAHFRQMKQ